MNGLLSERTPSASLNGAVPNGRGVMISQTDCYRLTDYGEPVVALKSYILSPFVDEENVEAVVRKVLEARERIGPETI